MSSALIDDYLAGLRRRLPAGIAEETGAGLIESYEHHRARHASDQEAARAALAEFGDLALVVGEFTRQAPGRRAARLLLATGPVADAAGPRPCSSATPGLGRSPAPPVSPSAPSCCRPSSLSSSRRPAGTATSGPGSR